MIKKYKAKHTKQEQAPDQAKLKPLMKPYVSEAQRRWAHTPAGTKALGGKKAVEHWDKESKGKNLPERMEKALSPEELQAQGYKFKILQPTKTRRAYVVRVYHGKKPIGHLAYSDRASHPPDENNPSYGYHHVFNSDIEPEHRGKGIYQHMLRLAANHVKSLGSKGIMSEGYQRSKDATRAWDKVATHANPYTYHAKLMDELSPKNSDYYLAASEQMKKGAQGDWKKEGYKIVYGKPYSDHLGTVHTIHVIPPNTKKFDPETDEGAAWFQINELYHPVHGRHIQVSDAFVHPEHQKKGIASAVYNKIEKDTGLKIVPFENEQTPEAKALWAQPNRPFGKAESKKVLSSNLNKGKIPGGLAESEKPIKDKAKKLWDKKSGLAFINQHMPQIKQHGFGKMTIIGSVANKGFSNKDLDVHIESDEYESDFEALANHFESHGYSVDPEAVYENPQTGDQEGFFSLYHPEKNQSIDLFFGKLQKPKTADQFTGKSKLSKSLKGDWKKEGYTFAHYHNPGIDQHRIKAFAPSGEVVGSFIFENNNGKWMPTSIQVKEPHRRKGLASAALSLFESKTGSKLHPHTDRFGESKQSSDAQALWAQPNRPFGKSEHKKALIEENFEPLQKGKKDILNMMGSKPEQHHHEFANWASKALPNSNWQTWAARHYKNKPEDFTPEVKQKIEHYAGSQHIPDIANVRFDKQHDLHTGLQMLESAEKQYHDKIKDNINVVKPRKTTTKFVHGVEKPNRHWFDLGVGSCENEGKAMVHCGNVPSVEEGDTILSFRTEHKINDKTYHEPHLTFIYNNGFLGEMKGRGNDKPAKHYHREIVNLLKDPRIKGVIGGGFRPESNFHFSDLSPELQQEVLQANPNLITSTDINNNENVEKILSRIDELPEKHKDILVDIARNPNLDPKHHEKLVNDNYISVKEAIASNPNLDPKYHEKLVNDDYIYVKEAIASNPNLDPKYHEKLVNDDYPSVKRAIASNPNLDPKYHEQLVNDDYTSVKRAIASNPNLDPKYYNQLVNDDDPWIVEAIARNPNLDPKHHKKLVNYDDLAVKRAIASNPNLDPKYYNQLANDTDPYVVKALKNNPSYQKWKKEQSKKLAASEKDNIKYKILTKSEENQLVKILENKEKIDNMLKKNWSSI